MNKHQDLCWFLKTSHPKSYISVSFFGILLKHLMWWKIKACSVLFFFIGSNNPPVLKVMTATTIHEEILCDRINWVIWEGNKANISNEKWPPGVSFVLLVRWIWSSNKGNRTTSTNGWQCCHEKLNFGVYTTHNCVERKQFAINFSDRIKHLQFYRELILNAPADEKYIYINGQ